MFPTREEVINDDEVVYCGQSLAALLPNIHYVKSGGTHLATGTNKDEIIFRGIFKISGTSFFFRLSGGLGGNFEVKSPEKSRFTCMLEGVPSTDGLPWATQDWAVMCRNVQSVVETVSQSTNFESAASLLHQHQGYELLKLSFPMFVENSERKKEGREPPYDFKTWPLASKGREAFKKVESFGTYDINPLPALEHQGKTWVSLPAHRYEQLDGALVDVEFTIGYVMSGNGPRFSGKGPKPLTVPGNAKNNERLVFWAIPVMLRILRLPAGSIPSSTKRLAMYTDDSPSKRQRVSPPSSQTVASSPPSTQSSKETLDEAKETTDEAEASKASKDEAEGLGGDDGQTEESIVRAIAAEAD